MVPSLDETLTPEPFCVAALIGLRVLEGREGRGQRFGAEADARWEAFRGRLHLGHRIELLLRDAAVTWGGAFSPSRAWAMPDVAGDEPFGPSWPGLDRNQGRRLWNRALALGELEPLAAFDVAAEAWGAEIRPPVDPASEPGPSMSFLVAGLGALRHMLELFSNQTHLSWPDQVTVLADDPATHQLAGLSAVLLGAPRATPVVPVPEGGDPAAVLDQANKVSALGLGEAVHSPDASPSVRRVLSAHGVPSGGL